jgi:mono/diheme cytochrome c family protein
LSESMMIRFGAVLVGAAIAVTASAQAQSVTMRRLLDGERMFHSYCAACHGQDGRGHGPAAPALKNVPADLTLIASRNGGTFPTERIVQYVANGDPATPAHGSKEMPVWGPILTALELGANRPVNERIETLVAYLQSIQKTR